MKRFNKGLIAVLILAIGSVFLMESCKKEVLNEELKENNPKILTSQGTNGLRIFSSLEDYDFYLENYDFSDSVHDNSSLYSTLKELEQQRLENYEAYLANPALADTIFDSYGPLLDILNKDKIVQIGDYLFKVDLQDELVHYIAASVSNSYNLLMDETDSRIQALSTDVDVLHDVNLGVQPFIMWPWGCSDPKASTGSNWKSTQPTCGNKNRYRSKKEMKYQKAGIYFSLMAQIKNQKRLFRIWWAAGPTPDINWVSFDYKIRCREQVGRTYDPSIDPSYIATGNKASVRVYHGSRGLAYFHFTAYFDGKCTSNVSHTING